MNMLDNEKLIIKNNRCIYCNSIESINIITGESSMNSNKDKDENWYFACKDKKVCENNLTNNSSTELIITSDGKLRLENINGDYIEIEYKEVAHDIHKYK
jgi:hypothetical protein